MDDVIVEIAQALFFIGLGIALCLVWVYDDVKPRPAQDNDGDYIDPFGYALGYHEGYVAGTNDAETRRRATGEDFSLKRFLANKDIYRQEAMLRHPAGKSMIINTGEIEPFEPKPPITREGWEL